MIHGKTQRGKPCKIVDNTASVCREELERLLITLIEEDSFGLKGISDGEGRINLDKPELAHIQIGEKLYKLLLYRYEAHIEKF
ncbi:MAG: hypothetical protein OEX00_04905 [Gammaproteobacteria bacterium]|nr:hypothetical protein [Gammaproteobacteria bacterium]MDH5693569.1 hypothetical protein [Gammaproteobacteria bacterium]